MKEGGGERQMGAGWYRAIKPASDTQSASHSLAIVVWNLRNAFDRLAVPAWVLFWRSPEDKTVTREEKEKRQMRWWGVGTGYLDSFRVRLRNKHPPFFFSPSKKYGLKSLHQENS